MTSVTAQVCAKCGKVLSFEGERPFSYRNKFYDNEHAPEAMLEIALPEITKGIADFIEYVTSIVGEWDSGPIAKQFVETMQQAEGHATFSRARDSLWTAQRARREALLAIMELLIKRARLYVKQNQEAAEAVGVTSRLNEAEKPFDDYSNNMRKFQDLRAAFDFAGSLATLAVDAKGAPDAMARKQDGSSSKLAGSMGRLQALYQPSEAVGTSVAVPGDDAYEEPEDEEVVASQAPAAVHEQVERPTNLEGLEERKAEIEAELARLKDQADDVSTENLSSREKVTRLGALADEEDRLRDSLATVNSALENVRRQEEEAQAAAAQAPEAVSDHVDLMPGSQFVAGKCEQCETQNPEGMKFCGNCGSKLPEAPAEPEPEPVVAGLCANCGTQNPEGNRFCSNCGQSLTQSEAPAATANEAHSMEAAAPGGEVERPLAPAEQ